MDENIKSKLAIDIAQLSLDKATLAAQCEEYQAQLKQALEEQSYFEAVLTSEPALKELFEEVHKKYKEEQNGI